MNPVLDNLPPVSDLPGPADKELAQVKDALRKNLHPVRSMLPPAAFLAAFVSVFAALLFASTFYYSGYGWDMLLSFQKAAVFSTIIAAAALLSFSLVRQIVPGSGVSAPGRWVAGIIVMLCLTCAAVFQGRLEVNFLRNGEACLAAGIPFALPAAFLFWLLLSRGASLSPLATGATAGSLAGLVSTGVLEIHCPNMNLWHILTWHVGISAGGGIAGLLLAWGAERWRLRT